MKKCTECNNEIWNDMFKESHGICLSCAFKRDDLRDEIEKMQKKSRCTLVVYVVDRHLDNICKDGGNFLGKDSGTEDETWRTVGVFSPMISSFDEVYKKFPLHSSKKVKDIIKELAEEIT